jgi:hypothetical protein
MNANNRFRRVLVVGARVGERLVCPPVRDILRWQRERLESNDSGRSVGIKR